MAIVLEETAPVPGSETQSLSNGTISSSGRDGFRYAEAAKNIGTVYIVIFI